MFKGMVPPGLFQATCVSGAPPGPNRVLQGQQKQNEAQEKKELLYHKYIYTYIYEVHKRVLYMKSRNARL